ncbi:MAG: Asp-tRNA(Asn)/Glu-tRNA(Gln) amidotransferase subunit GatB [Chitinophagales bacterium]|nr:Asp-tRNA(Asn)/Glu-tRNA(Gln) amidotransferase subunit GatB [Bacteroidota bacterium]MCB9256185.1 Asp-tRNA(Asn)/Glu-tRNA(Gln) amidotransferase subunit GatB [Chitinophagales bacterium]
MSAYDKYEIVIGLEVHAQLSTASKMYCSDNASFGSSPNTNLSPITLGHPGTLPKVNKTAIDSAIKMGLATNCKITAYNGFARKNYFYADLPKGYQITQDKTPICTAGHLDIHVNEQVKTIGITRIHLEEDAGKSTHDLDPYNSLIDLNRAGVPLIEIVSEPDMRSSEEAYQYLIEIRKLLRYLEICDGNMEEGSMRCDANISVRLKGAKEFGERCEVKNMNSMRNVARAIEFEARRQIDLIEQGGIIDQQTRSFNAADGSTFTLRSKENANDYRYFPEPDLPPFVVSDAKVASIKALMPKLSSELFQEYTEKYGLSAYDANIISEDKYVAKYYNEIISHTSNYKAAANWLLGPVKSYLNEKAVEIKEFPIAAEKIAQIIGLIEDAKLNFTTASLNLFPALLSKPDSNLLALATELNIIQNSDSSEIEKYVDAVLAELPEKVAEYKAGKSGLMGLFMGQVMKKSGGKADPKLATKILNEKLK